MLEINVIVRQVEVGAVGFPLGVLAFEWIEPLILIIDPMQEQEVGNLHLIEAFDLLVPECPPRRAPGRINFGNILRLLVFAPKRLKIRAFLIIISLTE